MERKSFGIRMEKNLLERVDDYAAEKDMTRSEAIENIVRSKMEATMGKAFVQTQDQESGAAAAKWGREVGPLIAKKFGAEQIRPNVNEFLLDGQRIALKTASRTNNQIGVYNSVRDRVKYIWGAFEKDSGLFEVYELTPTVWKKHAREAVQSSANHGKLTLMNHATFKELSTRKVGELYIPNRS